MSFVDELGHDRSVALQAFSANDLLRSLLAGSRLSGLRGWLLFGGFLSWSRAGARQGDTSDIQNDEKSESP